MVRLAVALIFIISFSWVVSPQTGHIDSLKQLVYDAKTDQEKLKAILLLCDEFQSLNRDTFDLYTIQAKQLAYKSGEERNMKLSAIVTANNYYRWGWMDSAMAVITPVLKEYEYPVLYLMNSFFSYL